ncbi:hypothetical protein C8Q76DRAFT_600753, partial [Earliella scabrosa]
RVTWVVPVLLGDRIPRGDRGPEEREEWARTVLLLFRPWRSECDIRFEDESWTDAYERQRLAISPLHQDIIENMNVLCQCKDARDQ